jgi:hypothetical protein
MKLTRICRMYFCAISVATLLAACGGSDGDGGSAATADKYPLVPTPTVTVLPSAGISSDRNYPFLAADFNPKAFGYVEEEFLIEGNANSYDTPNPTIAISPIAKVVTTDNPYRTRMMVYRPTDPAKFNGTVIVEWVNATNGWDTPIHWFEQKSFIMRDGYAYMWVSNQNSTVSGVNGLKAWSPARYGTLDVTNAGKFTREELSYDIMSQAAKAVRADPKVIGGMTVKKVIFAGESQSAIRGGAYINAVHPLSGNIYDAALLTNWGPVMRTDLTIPVIKILTETEFASSSGTNETMNLQADTPKYKTWFVPGATHSNLTSLLPRATQYVRDFNGRIISDTCATPQNSRLPLAYSYNAAIVALVNYLDSEAAIPTSPSVPITPDPRLPTVLRDQDGIALGGIRYPDVDVPVALNSGIAVCNSLGGTHVPFTKSRLDVLYPTHASYVSKVTASATKLVSAGFMLQADANDVIANAQSSIYGYQLNCDGALCTDQSLFPQKPSILNLRWHIYLYHLPNSAKLLAPVDAAALRIAAGYNVTDPATREMYFSQAIALLDQYSRLVQDEGANGTLSQDAVIYLTGQSSNLATELQRLF